MTDYRRELRNAIALYQELGFSVIPLEPRSKMPLISWKPYQDKHMSDLEIEQYFFGDVEVNVGIVCGKISNLMVLDFDNIEAYHKAFPTWRELENQTIVVASSPTKRHVYGRIDQEFPSTKRLDLSVEAHSDGTYVVAPPSIHPLGHPYEFVSSTVRTLLPERDPDKLWKKIVGRIEGKPLLPSCYVPPCFDHVLTIGVGEGERDECAIRIASYLKSRKTSDVDITAVLLDWNKKNRPPLDSSVIPYKVSSAEKEYSYSCDKLRGCDSFKNGCDEGKCRVSADRYFEKNRFVAKRVADELMSQHRFATMTDTEEVFTYVDGVYQPIGEMVIKDETEKRLGEQGTTHRVNEVIGHVQRSTYADRKKFDADGYVLNVENGLLSTNEVELRNHDLNYLSVVRLPLHYDPKAECPKIQKFLGEILNEKDIPTVLEFFGYCLYRGYPIHKSFMLVGDGANGKSTLLVLLRAFLGKENCSSVSLQEFEESRFASGGLYNKMANIYPDLPSTALQQTGKFKMLVGEDLIGAEKKFGGKFTYENYAKMIFSTNRIPLAWDDSTAFYRRWIIINFPNIFVGDEADKHLIKKLTTKEELSGLLNLALGGMQQLLKSGEFTGAPTIEEARETYIRMSDSVGSFIIDRIEISSEDWIAKGELYHRFCEYCGENRYPVVSEKTFAERLSYHVKVEKYRPSEGDKRVTAWRGIRFKGEAEQAEIGDGTKEETKIVDLSETHVVERDTCGRCGRPLGEDRVWVGMGLGHICRDCERERTDEYFGR